MTDRNLKLLTRPDKISRTSTLVIPTDEHYRPMLAAMSLLYTSEELSYFNSVIDLGSVSMRSFVAG
jgi:4,5-DOPA dioxygenase extradiol